MHMLPEAPLILIRIEYLLIYIFTKKAHFVANADNWLLLAFLLTTNNNNRSFHFDHLGRLSYIRVIVCCVCVCMRSYAQRLVKTQLSTQLLRFLISQPPN